MFDNSSVATTPPDDANDIKSFPPTPAKKAWRRRLLMDHVTPPQTAPELNLLTPPTPEIQRPAMLADTSGMAAAFQPTSEPVGVTGEPLSPARIFACGQCGKCFVSLKYLDMHAAALHAGKWNTARDVIVVEPAQIASAVSGAFGGGGGVVHRGLLPVAFNQPFARPTTTSTELVFVQNDAAVTVATESRMPVPTPFPVQPTIASTLTSGRHVLSLPTVRSARNNEWKCDTCQKTFSQNSSYKNHQRTHSDERPFVCTICSIGFKERYHLKKHVLFKHTDELREECRVCGKRFKDTTAVRAHERIHSDERPYSCQRCRKAFKTSECLWHHENRSKSCGVGGSSVVVTPPSSSTTDARTAPAAAAVFAAARHQLKRSTEPASTRRPADLVSSSSSSSSFVEQKPRPIAVTSSQQRSSPTTAIFGPTVVTPSDETTHLMFDELQTAAMVDVVDSSYRRYDDDDDDDSSTSPTKSGPPPRVKAEVRFAMANNDGRSLRDGLVLLADCAVRVPEPEMIPLKSEFDPIASRDAVMSPSHQPPLPPPLQVKVEPEVVLADYELTAMTSSESSFYERMREMTSESDAMLETDDSSLSKTSLSSIGSTIKDGDSRRPEVAASATGRRLVCQRCGRQFSSTKAYDKHIVIHSESRPYTCDKCQVGFKLKVHLKKHVLYRHSDDYHCSCRHCGKKFKDSSAVRLHERIHSTERPFSCSSCGKSFKTRENLWGHRHRGPCGLAATAALAAQQDSAVSACQSSGTSPEGDIEARLSTATGRSSSTAADDVGLITARPDVSWSSAVSDHVVKPVTSLTDDWIAKLLAASAAATRRSAADVTPMDNASISSSVSGGAVTSSGEATIMTAAEQQALLNKAIILSRLLQSQCAAAAAAVGGRQLFHGAGIIATASMPSTSGFISSLPTAVVTPMKRKTPDADETMTAAVSGFNPMTDVPAAATVESSPAVASSTAQQSSAASPQLYSSAGKAHLPPIETFRANHLSSAGGASSRSEIDAPPEVNTSSLGACPGGAVNLSLHSSSGKSSVIDVASTKTGNRQQAAVTRFSIASNCHQPETTVSSSSSSSRDSTSFLLGASDTLRRIAHAHGDVVRRTATVVGQGCVAEESVAQRQRP